MSCVSPVPHDAVKLAVTLAEVIVTDAEAGESPVVRVARDKSSPHATTSPTAAVAMTRAVPVRGRIERRAKKRRGRVDADRMSLGRPSDVSRGPPDGAAR